jgi:hypothetical protein
MQKPYQINGDNMDHLRHETISSNFQQQKEIIWKTKLMIFKNTNITDLCCKINELKASYQLQLTW